MAAKSSSSEFYEPLAEPEPSMSARERLRAFEDEVLGTDAIRIEGHVERGHGSRFKAMTPEQHAQYTVLEALIAAEKKIADASADLAMAEAAHAAATAKLTAFESKSDGE